MDNFKTFQEDLASGRPAKKPVSSNLLKQRAKENEKALKSGFMKMPDYVKKKFNEEEEVKPHKMYKGDKVVVAKNKAEHDKLNKQGYTHDDPKTKKVEEEKKNCGCGQDPCITYGKKQMKEEDGSYYGKPSPRLKKKVKGGKEVVNNPYSKDDGKTVVAKQKKYQPQLSKSKQGVNNVLNFLKKNPDYKIGPHSLKKGVNEVSDHTKSSYIGKANKEISNLEKAKDSAHKDMGKDSAPVEKHMDKKITKRRKGVRQARKDLKRPQQFNSSKGVWEDKNWPRPFSKSERDEFLDKAPKGKHIKKLKKAVNSKPEPSAYQFKDGKFNPLYRKESKKPVVHFKGEDKLKTLKIKLNPKKKIGVKVTDIGPGGKEVVRKNTMKEEQIRIVEALASKYFSRDPESNSFNRTKRKETTVRVGQKRDKKTGKMVDVMGKTSAPQGLPQKKR